MGRVVGAPRPRRPVEGRGGALRRRAEGAHVPPDRRVGGRPDDVPAGEPRRRPELGLPLLLAARRHVHARRTGGDGPHGGGDRLAGLAAAHGGRRPLEAADHVRATRGASAPGGGAPVAPRLRGLGPGPHRQRRIGAVPARRVRRGDRLAPPGAQGRHRDRPERLGARAHAAPGPVRALAPPRRGDLGGALRASPLHPLEGARLGGLRPRREGGRALRAARPGRRLAGAPRRHQGGGAGGGVGRRTGVVRAVLRQQGARRLAPHPPPRRLPPGERRADGVDGAGDRARARGGRPRPPVRPGRGGRRPAR